MRYKSSVNASFYPMFCIICQRFFSLRHPSAAKDSMRLQIYFEAAKGVIDCRKPVKIDREDANGTRTPVGALSAVSRCSRKGFDSATASEHPDRSGTKDALRTVCSWKYRWTPRRKCVEFAALSLTAPSVTIRPSMIGYKLLGTRE